MHELIRYDENYLLTNMLCNFQFTQTFDQSLVFVDELHVYKQQ